MNSCKQELCPNWSGDGRVCPCVLFDLDAEATDSHWDDDLELPESY